MSYLLDIKEEDLIFTDPKVIESEEDFVPIVIAALPNWMYDFDGEYPKSYKIPFKLKEIVGDSEGVYLTGHRGVILSWPWSIWSNKLFGLEYVVTNKPFINHMAGSNSKYSFLSCGIVYKTELVVNVIYLVKAKHLISLRKSIKDNTLFTINYADYKIVYTTPLRYGSTTHSNKNELLPSRSIVFSVNPISTINANEVINKLNKVSSLVLEEDPHF